MASDDLPLLVVTGGYGRVAGVLLPSLAARFRLHLVDRAAGTTSVLVDRASVGDLTNPGFAEEVTSGADAVLHLAGNASPTSPWPVAAENLHITQNVLAATELSGVQRVVLASSVHASGGDYRAGVRPVSTLTTPRPCCLYGVGKVALEALGRLHAERSGAHVVCLRFGLTGWSLMAREYADTWLADEDAGSLVDRALSTEVGFGVYHAVSRHAARAWSVDNAAEDLGWAPAHDLPVPLASLPPATSAPCPMFDLGPL